MADIEVDIAAVRRLESAARQVSSALDALSPRVTAAGTLPGGTFGRLPFISDYLHGEYATMAGRATEMFRAGQAAFGRVGDGLRQTAEAYERNEERAGRGFTALQARLPR